MVLGRGGGAGKARKKGGDRVYGTNDCWFFCLAATTMTKTMTEKKKKKKY